MNQNWKYRNSVFTDALLQAPTKIHTVNITPIHKYWKSAGCLRNASAKLLLPFRWHWSTRKTIVIPITITVLDTVPHTFQIFGLQYDISGEDRILTIILIAVPTPFRKNIQVTVIRTDTIPLFQKRTAAVCSSNPHLLQILCRIGLVICPNTISAPFSTPQIT